MAASVMIDDRMSRRAQLNARSGVPSLPVLTPVLSTDRPSQYGLRQWQLPPKPQAPPAAKVALADQGAAGPPREQREPRQPRTAATPRQDPQASEAALTELIRALRRLSAGEKLDEVSLEKLSARTDPAAAACVQVVRSIQQSLQDADAAAAGTSREEGGLGDSAASVGQMEEAQSMQDKQQLAAQVAFLERKIAKLREKVKKRTSEGSGPIGATVAGPPDFAQQVASEIEGHGTSRPSREKLIAEIERLRSETARTGPLRNAGKSEKHHPAGDAQPAQEEDADTLRARISDMQVRLASLSTEKEAAEASAEKARRLVVSVETRLGTVVSSQEAEQAELLEHQRQLQGKLEGQNAQLEELDKVSSHCEQRDRLQATLEELQRDVTQARSAASEKAGAQRGNAGAGSASAANTLSPGVNVAAPPNEASVPFAASATSGGAQKNSVLSVDRPDTSPEYLRSTDLPKRKAYEQALREQAEAQGALEQKAREVSQHREATASRVAELEGQIQQTRDDSQAVLTNLEAEHAREFEDVEQRHRSHLQQATEAREIEEQKQLKGILEELQAAESSHRSKMEAIRVDATARGVELEAQSAAIDAEVRRAQRHAELARREREFRGAMWLTVRRATFLKSEMIAFLSDVLEVPARRIRIIDDDATPSVDAPLRFSGALAGSARAAVDDNAGVQPEPPGAPVPLKGTRPVRRGRTLRGGEESKANVQETEGYFAMWRRGQAAEESKPTAGAAIAKKEEAKRRGAQQSKSPGRDPNLRCIFLEFIEDPMAPAHLCSGFSVAIRLLEFVRSGKPRAEPLAVVRAAVARGENVLASAWPGETAGVVERRVRKVQGWLFVVTVFLNLEPFIVKFAAFDETEGREFHLHLDEDDVNAIAAGASALRPLEMIDAVVPSLRVINRDGRLLLAAVQEARAPPTICNEVDPTLVETAQMSAAYRRLQRQLTRKQAPASAPLGPPPVLRAPGALTRQKTRRTLPGQEAEALTTLLGAAGAEEVSSSWNVVREDVLFFEDRFVLLCVEHERSSSSIRLTLQEAGRCRPFQMLLPGNDLGSKQQRIFAQFCDLGGLSLHLMVEEIAAPPLLVVRLVSAESDEYMRLMLSKQERSPGATAEALPVCDVEAMFCISTDDWRVVDADLLRKCPGNRREQLLQFLVQMPTGAKVAVEGLNAVSLASQGLKAAAAGAGSELGSRVAYGPGLTCFAQVNAAAKAHSLRTWTMLAQCGRRISQAGEERLHVVRIYQRPDPYSQFLIWAHQIGTCRDWEFLVSAEDLLRCLPELSVTDTATTSGSLQAEAEWNACVAQELLQHCMFVSISGQQVLSVRRAGEGEDRGLGAEELRVLVSAKPDKAGEAREAAGGVLALSAGMPNLFDRACLELTGATGARTAGALLPAGGRYLDLSEDSARRVARERTVLHQGDRLFGDLELALSLEALPSRRGHVLSAYNERSLTQFELTLTTRDGACPEKFSVERVSVAGKPLVFVLAEASFPHALHALVRDPSSLERGKEFRCTLRDEDIFTMLQRPHRQLLARCAQELVQFGAVGDQGAGTRGFMEMACGALTDLPSVTLEQVDQSGNFVVPVLRVPFSPKAVPPPSDELPVMSIGSASFAACDRNFRVSLTKAQASEDFTLGIGEEDSGSMHLMQLCDRFSRGVSGDEPPMCLYSEVREVAGVSLLVLTLLDAAPRALRVAVVELSSLRMFQMIVLDAAGGPEVLPYPDAVPSRQQVLDAYLSGFVAAPMTPISTRALSAVPALPAPPRPASSASQQQGASALAESSAVVADAGKQEKPKAFQLMFRTTRKLPSGQPVVLTVVRERLMDTFFRFQVLMYHPVTAREMKIALVNPLLDKVLNACGLEDSKVATVEQIDAKGKEVALHILSYAYVHPDGADIEFRSTAVDARPAAKLR
mmetsp:Transcript_53825/g.93485  ORF Transcript_53825/g.93485 Transcript_53825/m.93485 type:complete len:1909 (-) Transcript_53825:63-5789(-)